MKSRHLVGGNEVTKMDAKIIFGMFCMVVISCIIDIYVPRYRVCVSLLSIALWHSCASVVDDNRYIDLFTIVTLVSLWTEPIISQGIGIYVLLCIILTITMITRLNKGIWDDITLDDIISTVGLVNITLDDIISNVGLVNITLDDIISNVGWNVRWVNITLDGIISNVGWVNITLDDIHL